MQSDFESFYFSTNRRRFENPTGGITFTTRDRSQYKIDTLSLVARRRMAGDGERSR